MSRPSIPHSARTVPPLLFALLWLSACSVLPGEGETLQILDLQVRPDAVEVVADPVDLQLGVDVFRARVPVSGVRIAVLEEDGVHSVLRGARWSLPAPRLLQAVLVQAFEHAGAFAGVAPVGALQGDCVLGGELRAMHWRPATGEVELRIAARLQCGPAGEVVAMRTFEARAPVAGRGAPAVANAFEGALAEVARPLVDWARAGAR
ncbi:MAG: ABC-type transport auxiliary lipoprotein family protein [Gammaproteobacteria bacterium]|nr:ABC-type transport auxiliary lipoprotein family protein [Gammaproteobacteria bacterium]